jgi:pimeloyl-ACP methyl ester carboxylesterase
LRNERPLKPSRSETFPYRERVFLYGDDEVPVVYFDSGPSRGPTLLFVHGLGGNLTHFEYLTGPLAAEGYRVCGLDMPGFGISGKPHREYTIPYLSGAVLKLMDHLGIDEATLVGHSLGGLVVSDVGLRAPQRVERLVLISSAGLFKMPLPMRLIARTFLRKGWLTLALEMGARQLLDVVLAADNVRTERFIEQSVTRPDPRFVIDLARVMVAAKRDLTGYNVLSEAERLKMPTLVIWGAKDRLLPFKAVPAWARKLPDGELEVIAECGHMSMIEEPERVLTRMRAFFERSSGVSPAMASRAS